MNINEDFRPAGPLRHPMVQTVLNSSSVRTLGRNPMDAAAEEVVLELDGARLQGFMSRQRGRGSGGIVILLHGWEGSARSAYILDTGKFLYGAGYDVFRLNFRDHGDSHGLNRGLFMGTLLDEVCAAVAAVAEMAGGAPVFLAGFSMGANFAVRVAARCSDRPVPGLCGVLAINPPLDPMKATVNIDRLPLVKRYFIKKWKGSLARKQELFPGAYDFSDILRMRTCLEMTEAIIPRYSSYRSAAEYFRGYSLAGEVFDRVGVPLTMIMAADDPIIPIEDFFSIRLNKNTALTVQRYGGHCGYIENISMRPWYHALMLELFTKLKGA